jgi:hypothetical protein
MAYKRTTKKTGPRSRKSVTFNTTGPTTYSSSSTHAGETYTHTSKNGKYYTTRTTRTPSGYVQRERVSSSSPRKTNYSSQNTKSSGGNLVVFLIIIALGFFFFGR